MPLYKFSSVLSLSFTLAHLLSLYTQPIHCRRLRSSAVYGLLNWFVAPSNRDKDNTPSTEKKVSQPTRPKLEYTSPKSAVELKRETDQQDGEKSKSDKAPVFSPIVTDRSSPITARRPSRQALRSHSHSADSTFACTSPSSRIDPEKLREIKEKTLATAERYQKEAQFLRSVHADVYGGYDGSENNESTLGEEQQFINEFFAAVLKVQSLTESDQLDDERFVKEFKSFFSKTALDPNTYSPINVSGGNWLDLRGGKYYSADYSVAEFARALVTERLNKLRHRGYVVAEVGQDKNEKIRLRSVVRGPVKKRFKVVNSEGNGIFKGFRSVSNSDSQEFADGVEIKIEPGVWSLYSAFLNYSVGDKINCR